jgi:hypothetical protein
MPLSTGREQRCVQPHLAPRPALDEPDIAGATSAGPVRDGAVFSLGRAYSGLNRGERGVAIFRRRAGGVPEADVRAAVLCARG